MHGNRSQADQLFDGNGVIAGGNGGGMITGELKRRDSSRARRGTGTRSAGAGDDDGVDGYGDTAAAADGDVIGFP